MRLTSFNKNGQPNIGSNQPMNGWWKITLFTRREHPRLTVFFLQLKEDQFDTINISINRLQFGRASLVLSRLSGETSKRSS